MKENNLSTGHLGEAIAKEYLENQGYKIIVQNYRTKYCEIDLIARDKKSLVFVEVKTKIGEEFGSPEEAITRSKIRRLTRGVFIYLTREGDAKDYRIDAVCIVLDKAGNAERISHHKNITF